jgi:hypothetical protein
MRMSHMRHLTPIHSLHCCWVVVVVRYIHPSSCMHARVYVVLGLWWVGRLPLSSCASRAAIAASLSRTSPSQVQCTAPHYILAMYHTNPAIPTKGGGGAPEGKKIVCDARRRHTSSPVRRTPRDENSMDIFRPYSIPNLFRRV